MMGILQRLSVVWEKILFPKKRIIKMMKNLFIFSFRWVLVCIEKYSYLCKVLITKKEECGYSREF